jgi:hypothetical protein
MSFVLEYLTVGGVRPDLEGFDAWTRESPLFQEAVEQDDHKVWWYRNPWTNVYFSVSYRYVDPLQDQLWAPSGLEAMVNHLRPDYFALEAAPYLAAIARDFGMLARDADSGQLLSMDPEPDQIERLWDVGNRLVRDDAIEQGKRIHRLSGEANRRWWEYSRRRSALQEFLRREDPRIEVPEIHFLHSRSLDRILTAFAWKDGSGTVFPASDLVVIDRTEKHFLGLKKERKLTYVSYDALVRQVVAALRNVEFEGVSFRYLSTENAWRAVERLASIPQNEDLDSFQNIHSTRVVDDA